MASMTSAMARGKSVFAKPPGMKAMPALAVMSATPEAALTSVRVEESGMKETPSIHRESPEFTSEGGRSERSPEVRTSVLVQTDEIHKIAVPGHGQAAEEHPCLRRHDRHVGGSGGLANPETFLIVVPLYVGYVFAVR